MERLKGIVTGDAFKNKEPRSRYELSAEEYLKALTEQDRENMQSILSFTESLDQKLPYARIAITAVGSTMYPKEQRHHPAEDIDLRILNSAPVNSLEREDTILELQDAIRNHLTEQELDYTEDDRTVSTKLIEGYSGGEKELVPFTDYDNSDLSFTVQFPQGLPFHISLSGLNNIDLDSYLEAERKNNGHFALLYQS